MKDKEDWVKVQGGGFINLNAPQWKKKEKKKFEPFKTRPIRLSDKTWDTFKAHKTKSGKSWNLFVHDVNDLLNNKK